MLCVGKFEKKLSGFTYINMLTALTEQNLAEIYTQNITETLKFDKLSLQAKPFNHFTKLSAALSIKS